MIWVERDSGYEQSWSRKRVWLAQNNENAERIEREIERESEKVKWRIITHTPFLRVQGCYQVDLVVLAVLALPLGFIFWVYAYLIPCLFSKKRKQIEN